MLNIYDTKVSQLLIRSIIQFRQRVISFTHFYASNTANYIVFN